MAAAALLVLLLLLLSELEDVVAIAELLLPLLPLYDI